MTDSRPLSPPDQISPNPGLSSYLLTDETPFTPLGQVTAAAINAAIAALPPGQSGGGRIVLPRGDFTLTEPINADQTYNVQIEGAGSSYGGTRLKSADPAMSLVTARSSGGFCLRNLALYDSSAAYSGRLLNLDRHPAGPIDTALATVDNCNLTVSPSASNTGYLIAMDGAISCRFHGNYLIGGYRGISGYNALYSNAHLIDGNYFQNQVAASIADLHDACTIIGNTFEPLLSGAAGAYFQDATTPCYTLTIASNYCGDASAAAGSWLVIAGVGITIIGNLIFTGATGIKSSAACEGLAILGNGIGHLNTGIDLSIGVHDRVALLANNYDTVPIPVTPTNSWGAGSIGELGDGTILFGGNIANAASVGGATALPAQPAGYITIHDANGNTGKVPYYNP